MKIGMATAICLLLCLLPYTFAQEVFLGEFREILHRVNGKAYAISDRIIEIRDFEYDGQGPTVYFWLDENHNPSSNGFGLTSPDNIPACGMNIGYAADGTTTTRVELPEDKTLKSYAGGSLSVWCELFGISFGDLEIPENLDDLPIGGSEILRCATESSETNENDNEMNGDDTMSEGLLIGPIIERAHGTSGIVIAKSEHVLQIMNFTFDGEGPAAKFWADKSPIPSSAGMPLLSPDNDPACSTHVNDMADGSKTVTVEFPDGMTLYDFLGGSISLWCEQMDINFGEVMVPESIGEIPTVAGISPQCAVPNDPGSNNSINVPEIAQTPDNYNCEPLDDDLQIRWRVAGAAIDFELVGRVNDGDYMGFGKSGSPDSVQMIGADVVIAYHDGIDFRARDLYLSSRGSCSKGVGACPDENFQFGGEAFNDAFNIKGDSVHGLTKIRYARPIKTRDEGLLAAGYPVDQPIDIEEQSSVIWAIGPMNLDTDLPSFHRKIAREHKLIKFGRPVTDNCSPLVTIEGTPPPTLPDDETSAPVEDGDAPAPTAAPVQPYGQRLIQSSVRQLHARIGFSGGEKRGYPAITGRTGWGIAWYINDKLIPEIIMQRGKTYRFFINGGDDTDPAAAASYHPFYLTSSESGGFGALNATERAKETIYAGVEFDNGDSIASRQNSGEPIEDGTFRPTGVGPLCKYVATDETREIIEDTGAGYKRYFESLNRSCANDTDIIENAGILEFTPDESTPDEIFYQCFTHQDLGWKIRVRDAITEPPSNIFAPGVPTAGVTAMPTAASISTPTSAPSGIIEDNNGTNEITEPPIDSPSMMDITQSPVGAPIRDIFPTTTNDTFSSSARLPVTVGMKGASLYALAFLIVIW